MHRKIPLRIGPGGARMPAGSACERRERGHGILIAVLGVNGFARTELDNTAGNPNLLPAVAGEVHLNAMPLGIVESMMREARKIKIGVELPIHPDKQIEIEFRREPSAVVIGGI